VQEGRLVDLFNGEEAIPFSGGKARITVPSCWARVMALQ
jgi:hypothetical protein